MKNITKSILCFSSLLFLPFTFTNAKDVHTEDEFKRPVIHRSLIIKSPNGENINISQKFLKVGANELMYIKGSSSRSTLEYGKKFCLSKGQTLDIEYGSKTIPAGQNNYLLSCSDDKNLVNTTMAKAYSLAPKTNKSKLFNDVISYNEKGEKIIERSSFQTGINGKKYQTSQKFIEIKPDKLLYIPNSSSYQTIEYINEVCKAINSKERINKGSNIISPLVPVTIACEGKNKQLSLRSTSTANSVAEECNVNSIAHSTDARPNTNAILSGSFYYSNVTSLNTKISFFDYYNEIFDANRGIDYGNSEIFLNVLAPAQENAYPFSVTGTSQICTNTAQGALAVF